MPLQLELIQTDTVPIEVPNVLPEVVKTLAPSEIADLMIYHGNRERRLADLFRIQGSVDDHEIHWRGELSGVHWIGTRMSSGKMVISGNAGRHVGSEMSGGEIHVTGNVGDWVGAELKGGLIHVQGDAGHLVGAAYRGSPVGMTGGTILIEGGAGNEIGHSLRRGLIVVGGATGDLIGFNMLAGTIIAYGPTGIRHGAGMKRGTLMFLDATPPPLLPTFRLGCRCLPLFVQLLSRHLETLGFSRAAELRRSEYDLYHGDLIEGGRGELLTSVASPLVVA